MTHRLRKNDDGIYVIEEINTGHILSSHDKYADAQRMYKEYKNGRGFEGWTPAFILN